MTERQPRGFLSVTDEKKGRKGCYVFISDDKARKYNSRIKYDYLEESKKLAERMKEQNDLRKTTRETSKTTAR